MNSNTINKLLELDKSFYIKTASSFSKTRNYGWKGWEIALDYIKNTPVEINSVLDIACGNGRFIKSLKEYFPQANYIGVDNNIHLLNEAKSIQDNQNLKFFEFDVLSDWELVQGKFDLITVFGFMHHIPSKDLRLKLLKTLKGYMHKMSYLCVSFWDFLGKGYHLRTKDKSAFIDNSLDISKLGANDYILDWRAEVKAYRYAHAYSQDEIDELFKSCGFESHKSFYADGRDGKSNRYEILMIKK